MESSYFNIPESTILEYVAEIEHQIQNILNLQATMASTQSQIEEYHKMMNPEFYLQVDYIQNNLMNGGAELDRLIEGAIILINDTFGQVANYQGTLLNVYLLDWKMQQKYNQLGKDFENKAEYFDKIQFGFEFLADRNQQLSQQLSTLMGIIYAANGKVESRLEMIGQELRLLLETLITESIIVFAQPEPVLRKGARITSEIRFLLEKKLNLWEKLPQMTVKIIMLTEEEARKVACGHVSTANVTSVGRISVKEEKVKLGKDGHYRVQFIEPKLLEIDHRNQRSRTIAAADQIYSFLFVLDSMQVQNVFKLSTLSGPFTVTVHCSQDCEAHGSIFWKNASPEVTWKSSESHTINWDQLKEFLRYEFKRYTGTNRMLSDEDLEYLKDKLQIGSEAIGFNEFARIKKIGEAENFSFWTWFFEIMYLVKNNLSDFWDEGWCKGFITRERANYLLEFHDKFAFLLRFSESQLGAVSICFAHIKDNQRIIHHMVPFNRKDLVNFSLAERIRMCEKEMPFVKYLYPTVEKEKIYKSITEQEPAESPGYIRRTLRMILDFDGRR